MFKLSPFIRIGGMIAIALIGLSALSWAFPYDVDLEQAPLGLYIGVATLAAGLWMWLPAKLNNNRQAYRPLLSILVIGLIARGAMFVSTPVLEDDSYRYLWDGAVTARGIDPYKYAPNQVDIISLFATEQTTPDDTDLAALQRLAADHARVHSRINYPYVATIYPPLTQAAFAVAHWIDPFGLTGWRLVLLAADLAAFGLLIALLKAHNRAPQWGALYWWNPIIILQGFGAGHMDILVVPFLLAALLSAKREQFAIAPLSLAGAVGIKLWPALLLPLILRPLLFKPFRLVGLGVLFVAVCFVLVAPQLIHALDPNAGLNAYASDWRTHAFLFTLLEDGVVRLLDDPGTLARYTVALAVSGTVAILALRYAHQPEWLPALVAIAIATLLFLSPTGYPWYLIWLAPLLPFLLHPGLQALMLTAPLYWLRFQLGDEAWLYQWVIVPIAFGAPLALIAHSLLKKDHRHEIGHHHSRAQ